MSIYMCIQAIYHEYFIILKCQRSNVMGAGVAHLHAGEKWINKLPASFLYNSCKTETAC